MYLKKIKFIFICEALKVCIALGQKDKKSGHINRNIELEKNENSIALGLYYCKALRNGSL